MHMFYEFYTYYCGFFLVQLAVYSRSVSSPSFMSPESITSWAMCYQNEAAPSERGSDGSGNGAVANPQPNALNPSTWIHLNGLTGKLEHSLQALALFQV